MTPVSADPKSSPVGLGWAEVKGRAGMKGRAERRHRRKRDEAGSQGARWRV